MKRSKTTTIAWINILDREAYAKGRDLTEMSETQVMSIMSDTAIKVRLGPQTPTPDKAQFAEWYESVTLASKQKFAREVVEGGPQAAR